MKGSPRKFQRIRVTSTSESDSDDSQSIPQTAAPLRNAQNGNRSQTHKNPVVLEKERQMRFLMENYPNTEAMVHRKQKLATSADGSLFFFCFLGDTQLTVQISFRSGYGCNGFVGKDGLTYLSGWF